MGAYVCYQLCPCAKQLVPLLPNFLTLGPELDNVGAAGRLMEVQGHDFRMLLRIFHHGVRVTHIQKKKKRKVKRVNNQFCYLIRVFEDENT